MSTCAPVVPLSSHILLFIVTTETVVRSERSGANRHEIDIGTYAVTLYKQMSMYLISTEVVFPASFSNFASKIISESKLRNFIYSFHSSQSIFSNFELSTVRGPCMPRRESKYIMLPDLEEDVIFLEGRCTEIEKTGNLKVARMAASYV